MGLLSVLMLIKLSFKVMDIKLHLGCWHRYIPGFIHIDLCDMEHIDYKSSIDDCLKMRLFH
jgi:hypothetical protein